MAIVIATATTTNHNLNPQPPKKKKKTHDTNRSENPLQNRHKTHHPNNPDPHLNPDLQPMASTHGLNQPQPLLDPPPSNPPLSFPDPLAVIKTHQIHKEATGKRGEESERGGRRKMGKIKNKYTHNYHWNKKNSFWFKICATMRLY